MISGHNQFIEAIHAKHKVCIRFYSLADSGVVDRVCAPLDYGPGGGFDDALNRYWLWDYTSEAETRMLALAPQQILDLRVLGEPFDSAQLNLGPRGDWHISRDWGLPQPERAGGQ